MTLLFIQAALLSMLPKHIQRKLSETGANKKTGYRERIMLPDVSVIKSIKMSKRTLFQNGTDMFIILSQRLVMGFFLVWSQ